MKQPANHASVCISIVVILCGLFSLSAKAQINGLRITSLMVSNENVTVRWEGGDPARPYQLQKARSLSEAWQNVDQPRFATNLASSLAEPNAFYRVEQGNLVLFAADVDSPTVPSALSAYSSNCSQVVLTWNSSIDDPGGSGLTSYNVYRNGAFLAQVQAWATSYLDFGVLSPATSYYYAILALDAAGNASSLSPAVVITTPVCGDPTAPTAPTAFTATAFTPTQVSLAWNPSTDSSGSGIAGYNIFRNGRFLKQVPSSVTATLDSGLAPGMTYAYSLSAVTFSGKQSAQVAAPNVSTSADTGPPSVPTGLTASPVSCSQVNLSWNASTDAGSLASGIKGYNIFRNGTFLAQVLAPNTTSSDTGLSASTTYNYSVSALDNAGNASANSPGVSVTIPACTCSYSLGQTNASYGSASGNGSLSLTASAGCSWTASTANSWIHLMTTNGIGNGTVNYSVDANTSTSARSATLTVGGQVFTINQSGASCSYSINPASSSFGASASSSSFTLSTPSGCSWSASTTVAWIHTTSFGSGNGTVNFTVDANASTSSRSGTITVGGQSFTVNQAGLVCVYALSSTNAFFSSVGGSGNVTMNVGSGCSWTASAMDGWIHTSSSGNGTASVNYSLDANAGLNPRSGSITVANQTLTITQSGTSCSYFLSSNSASFSSGAGNGSVMVIANGACNWTAQTGAGWISVIGGSSGAGSGGVTYSISPNSSSVSRTGAVMIADQTFQVSQAGNQLPVANAGSGFSATVGTQASFSGSGSFDPDGAIVSYQWDFGDGSTATGSSVTHIYAATGAYTVTLTVTDNLGATATATASATITPPPDLTPPTASLSSPANGSVISNTVTLAASVNDNVGISKVEFYRDNVLLGAALTTPYTLAVDTTTVANGTHTFYCKAYDAALNSTASAVASVTVLNPSGAAGQFLWFASLAAQQPAGEVHPLAVTVDRNGNVIVVGFFRGSVLLGSTSATSVGGGDVFVTRFLANGQFGWAKQFGTLADDSATGVAADSNGNIFIVGSSGGSLDFGGGALNNHGSPGTADIFLAKLSPAGSTLWSKGIGGIGNDFGNAVALDSSDNVFIAGAISFGSSVDLECGSLSSAGYGDAFVAKCSGPTGTCLWAKRAGGPGLDEARALAVDRGNNLLIAGNFQMTADIFGSLQTSTGARDIFVTKLSGASGSHVWTQVLGGPQDQYVYGLATDSGANVVIAGSYYGVMDFAGTPLSNPGSNPNMFLGALSSNGIRLWAKAFDDAFPDFLRGVTVDKNDNILLTGQIAGAVDFGSGYLFGDNQGDIFYAKFTPAGNYIWAQRFLGNGPDCGQGIAADAGGNVFVTGWFSQGVDFGGGLLSSPGGIGGFLVRFAP
jgi:chitodextrinase